MYSQSGKTNLFTKQTNFSVDGEGYKSDVSRKKNSLQIVMLGVQLLLHLPSPQKLASDQQVAEYSLALLDINARHFWLNTMILILYKVTDFCSVDAPT